MREIKFRAWGKNSKEFLSTGDGVFGLSLKNIQNIYDIDTWEFTQYTGLHDKNGKEIYEGDIVDHNGIVFEVVYDLGCFGLKKEGYLMQGVWYEVGKTEVIGNIYQNPELLEIKSK